MIVHESSQGRLIVIAGGNGEHYALARDTLTIGRSSLNDICLSWDPRVSRQHARLVFHDGSWILQDLGSTNGTFLETDRLEAPTPLRHGHRIRMGRIWLQVVMDHPLAISPRPIIGNTSLDADATLEAASVLVMNSKPLETFTRVQTPETPMTRPPVPPPPPPPPVTVAEPEEAPWLLEFPETDLAEVGMMSESATDLSNELGEEQEAFFPGVTSEPALVAVESAPIETALERAVAKVMASVAGCKETPLAMEILALAADPHHEPDADGLRQMIADLDLPVRLSAQLRETLGHADVAIALSAESGAQEELLDFAGQVVARLSEMPEYRDILITPRANGQ